MSDKRIIAVGGGKGGVGKSVVAANLAVAFAQGGLRVVLVDGDLGAANQHTLFGLEHKVDTLQALFDREVQKLDELLCPTSIPNLHLVVGSSGVPGAANIAHAQKQKLLRHIRALPADVVVVDVGAGVSFNTIDIFCVADVRLAVMTPQLPSVQNCYSFLKAAVVRELTALGETEAERLKIAEATQRQSAKVSTMLEAFAGTPLADRVKKTLSGFGAHLIGNQISSIADGNVLYAVERMVRDFLGISAPVLGLIPTSSRIHESINRRMPLLAHTRRDECARAIRQVAETLLRMPNIARPIDRARSIDRDAVDKDGMPDVEAFTRKHPRYAVRWKGQFEARSVAIEEVSLGGAVVRSDLPLEMGQKGWLEVTELRSRPRLWASVRNVRDNGVAGVEFLEETAEAARIVDAALEIQRTRVA